MSIQAVAWVLESSDTTGAARLILISIANHADDVGESWPSQDTIAREARVTPDAVKRTIRAMVKDGILERDIKAAPDRRIRADRAPNLYRIVGFRTRGTDDPPRDADEGDIQPVTRGTDDPPKPSEEPERDFLSSDPPTMEAIRLRRTSYPPEFEEAWNEYPRREDKRSAYGAWRARVIDAKKQKVDRGRRIEALRVAASNYAAAMAEEGRETRHMKLPATFWGPAEPWREYYRPRPQAGTSDYVPSWATGQRAAHA